VGDKVIYKEGEKGRSGTEIRCVVSGYRGVDGYVEGFTRVSLGCVDRKERLR